MKKLLLVAVTMLAFTFQSNAQWTTGTTDSDFDEGKKYAHASGEGDNYPYKDVSFLIREDGYNNNALWVSGFGYFSDYNQSELEVKIRVDKGEIFTFSGSELGTSTSNKALFIVSINRKVSRLIKAMKNGSRMTIRTFNGSDYNTGKFTLRGSTRAINFVGGYYPNSVASITDVNFRDAIDECLATHPVTGLCVDSEYGPMPDWDVSSVGNMSLSFQDRTDFDADISSWDVSNATNIAGMFVGASSFNQPIGNWDVSNVTNMSVMFSGASSFNQPIGNWDVSNVTDMSFMFGQVEFFNQDIGDWDVSNVTDMSFMFYQAKLFNQDISSWNVSNVTNMDTMFGEASAFNQPIVNWDVSNVTNMDFMFDEATSFNQDTIGWANSQILIQK